MHGPFLCRAADHQLGHQLANTMDKYDSFGAALTGFHAWSSACTVRSLAHSTRCVPSPRARKRRRSHFDIARAGCSDALALVLLPWAEHAVQTARPLWGPHVRRQRFLPSSPAAVITPNCHAARRQEGGCTLGQVATFSSWGPHSQLASRQAASSASATRARDPASARHATVSAKHQRARRDLPARAQKRGCAYVMLDTISQRSAEH